MLDCNTVWVDKYINYLNILKQPFHWNDLIKFDCDDKKCCQATASTANDSNQEILSWATFLLWRTFTLIYLTWTFWIRIHWYFNLCLTTRRAQARNKPDPEPKVCFKTLTHRSFRCTGAVIFTRWVVLLFWKLFWKMLKYFNRHSQQVAPCLIK